MDLSSKARERVTDVVLGDLDRSLDYYEQTVEPILLKRRRIYEADKDMYLKMFPRLDFSDYTSHDFYSWVQWALAIVLDSFFGTQKVVSIVGQGQDDADNAETMSQLIKWQVEQQNKGFLLYSKWFEEALIYDLGVLKCWWSRVAEPQVEQEKLPQDRIMMLGQTPGIEIVDVGSPDYFGDATVTYRRMVTTKNRPVLDHVSPFDIRWLPEARSLDESLFVAQRQIVTGDVLMQGAESGMYDKSVVDEVLESSENVAYTEGDLEQNPELDMYRASEKEKARKRIELFECYVKLDVNDDNKLEDLIVTIADRKILRIDENPFGRLPFFVISPSKDPTKVLSDTSMCDIEGELQHLRVAIVRQILLNVSNSNKPRTFFDMGKVNVEDLVRDKAYVRCSGSPADSIMLQPAHSLSEWTMQLIEYFRSLEEEWTGKTRYNQGTDANTLNKTATGISLIMKSSAQRINHIVKIFAETGVGELSRFLVKLNQSYMDQTQIVRLLNRPMQINPDDLEGNFDVVISVDVGLGEKEQMVNTLTSYLKEVFPFAMQLGIAGPADFSRACVRLLELLGWKDAKTFLRTPEEIQMMQQQQALLQQQQKAEQQAMAEQQAAQSQEEGEQASVRQAGQDGAREGLREAMAQIRQDKQLESQREGNINL